jgi:hypothetical protein
LRFLELADLNPQEVGGIMAYLYAPRPCDPDVPAFFNVHGVVGAAPAQNSREDVLLVQFAMNLLSSRPMETSSPTVLAAVKAVRMTGTIDAETVAAIRALQENLKARHPGQIVDGRVSPAKGGISYGTALWTVCHLNVTIQRRFKDIWPRIDKIPGCPGEIQQMVRRELIGSV